MLPARQGGDQHDEGALRQVKVGDKAVHDLEAVAGVDEDVGPARLGLHMPVLRRPALDGPAGGGAHADDPAPGGLGAVDEVRCLLGDDAVLAVHIVVQDVLLLHRPEGAQAHMEGHIADGDAHGLHPVHQLPGEVEPGGGGGGGAVVLGVDGLVPPLVLELLFDVGGQGHPPQPLQNLQEDALVGEADQAVAALHLPNDLAHQLPVPEGDPGAGPQLLPRADQTLPHVVPPVNEQQHLRRPAGRPVAVEAAAQEPGGQHPAVVHDEAVPGPQQVGQLVEVPVGPGPRHLVQRQQAGGVPPLQRRLGDKLLGQIKIKVMCFQWNYRILSSSMPVK